jgi:hypothetical protein
MNNNIEDYNILGTFIVKDGICSGCTFQSLVFSRIFLDFEIYLTISNCRFFFPTGVVSTTLTAK